MVDVGTELTKPPQESPPIKEAPRHISTMRLPPVGQIGGKDVRFSLHTDPVVSLMNFLRKNGAPDLSIEARLLTKDQAWELSRDPRFDFLENARMVNKKVDGELKDFMMVRTKTGRPFVKHSVDEMVKMLSEPFTPSSSALEAGFISLSTLFSEGPLARERLRACNELRLGSNSMSQEKILELATNLAKHVVDEEIKFIRLNQGDLKFEGSFIEFLPLDPSYLPPAQ